MDGIQIGYARVSTTDQDLTAQRDALLRLGVHDEHIYVDHGMTGANRARPGLREALAAVRSGDTLVVTKLDRLARSLRDAREIAAELTGKGVALSLCGSRYDPTDPVGRLLFNVLAMVAEFERDLISMRTREGMAGRSCQRKTEGQAAEAIEDAGSAAVRSTRPRRVHPDGDRGTVQRLARHRLSRASASPRAVPRGLRSAHLLAPLRPRSPASDVQSDTAAAS